MRLLHFGRFVARALSTSLSVDRPFSLAISWPHFFLVGPAATEAHDVISCSGTRGRSPLCVFCCLYFCLFSPNIISVGSLLVSFYSPTIIRFWHTYTPPHARRRIGAAEVRQCAIRCRRTRIQWASVVWQRRIGQPTTGQRWGGIAKLQEPSPN